MSIRSSSILLLVSFLSLTTMTVSCRQHRTPKKVSFSRGLDSNNDHQKEDIYKPENTKLKNSYSTDSLLQYLIPAPLTNNYEQIIQRKAYTLSYNKENKLPNWVAWHLTSDHTDGAIKRLNTYFEDITVPTPRATDKDYHGSSWTHGHMCPAGDNKWDLEAMQESNILTNICPQDGHLNTGLWNRIEQDCRKWAQKYGEIFIVCGPVLLNSEHETIGENNIVVPEAFFKVILRITPKPKAIGFVIRNNKGTKKRDQFINNVDEVERITGIDFFPALPNDIENEVESNANIDDWDH